MKEHKDFTKRPTKDDFKLFIRTLRYQIHTACSSCYAGRRREFIYAFQYPILDEKTGNTKRYDWIMMNTCRHCYDGISRWYLVETFK